MSDPSDVLPPGGYLLPNLPKGWLRDDPIAHALFGALDGALDVARQKIGALRAAHQLPTAEGADLEDLAALFDLRRAAGETDQQLRERIPASVLHGISASAAPDMAAYLQAAAGTPVLVSDGAVAGTFVVLFLGTPRLSTRDLRLLVDGIKAAGTTHGGRQALFGAPHSTRTGTFTAGTRRCGGSGGRGMTVVLW